MFSDDVRRFNSGEFVFHFMHRRGSKEGIIGIVADPKSEYTKSLLDEQAKFLFKICPHNHHIVFVLCSISRCENGEYELKIEDEPRCVVGADNNADIVELTDDGLTQPKYFDLNGCIKALLKDKQNEILNLMRQAKLYSNGYFSKEKRHPLLEKLEDIIPRRVRII